MKPPVFDNPYKEAAEAGERGGPQWRSRSWVIAPVAPTHVTLSWGGIWDELAPLLVPPPPRPAPRIPGSYGVLSWRGFVPQNDEELRLVTEFQAGLISRKHFKRSVRALRSRRLEVNADGTSVR